MKQAFFSLLLALTSFPAFSQVTSFFGQANFAYITNGPGNGLRLELEYTVRTAIGITVKEKWTGGLKMHQIYYRGPSPEFDNFWLAGPFVRYGMLTSPLGRFYAEGALAVGNYCTCVGPGVSDYNFRQDGLLYRSLGIGFELKIWKFLYFEAGYQTHNIINRPRPRYGYNHYVLGFTFMPRRVAGK